MALTQSASRDQSLALEFPLVGTFLPINVSNELVYLPEMCFSPSSCLV